MLPKIGDTIDDRFTINDELGSGGQGIVYLAKDRKFGQQCALKLAINQNTAANERFTREAKISHGLGLDKSLKGIVTAFHFGEHQNYQYMAMKFVSGSRPFPTKDDSIDFGTKIGLLCNAVGIISEIHRNGVIHRDVKPDNILISSDYSVFLTDFGLAKYQDIGELTQDDNILKTETGIGAGTPLYMPLEQFEDFKSVDQRADIFALGVILFEILTGQFPYNDRTPFLVAKKQESVASGETPLPDPMKLWPECPKMLANICKNCINPHREKRTKSASELAETLDDWLKNEYSDMSKNSYTFSNRTTIGSNQSVSETPASTASPSPKPILPTSPPKPIPPPPTPATFTPPPINSDPEDYDSGVFKDLEKHRLAGYPCPYCKVKHSSKEEFDQHLMNNHGDELGSGLWIPIILFGIIGAVLMIYGRNYLISLLDKLLSGN